MVLISDLRDYDCDLGWVSQAGKSPMQTVGSSNACIREMQLGLKLLEQADCRVLARRLHDDLHQNAATASHRPGMLPRYLRVRSSYHIK
jgi:hypothetical protein